MLISYIVLVADLAENAEKYQTNPDAKPPFSYATLICLAMRANCNKLTLSSIYAWIRENFMYYKHADPAWQVYANGLSLSTDENLIALPRRGSFGFGEQRIFQEFLTSGSEYVSP